MGRLEIYVSNGECKWDQQLDDPRAADRRSESARDRLRRGLKVFHDDAADRLDCYFVASTGTEHQYIATFHAAPGETLPGAALDALDRAAERLGWSVRTDSQTPYGLLRSAAPVETALSRDRVEGRVEAGETPLVLGAPDVESAIGAYRWLHESTDAVNSILVSRSGASSVMPDADVVLVPHEAERVGVPIGIGDLDGSADGPDSAHADVEEAERAVFHFLATGETARRVKRDRLASELAARGVRVSPAAEPARSLRDSVGSTVARVSGALRRLFGRSSRHALSHEERAALDDAVDAVVGVATDPALQNATHVLSREVLEPHGLEVDAVDA